MRRGGSRSGCPRTGVELLPDDSYILEMGFERLNGVDFRKGCYVGQEVTARMKHKTELRKGLVRVRVEGGRRRPAPRIRAGGKACRDAALGRGRPGARLPPLRPRGRGSSRPEGRGCRRSADGFPGESARASRETVIGLERLENLGWKAAGSGWNPACHFFTGG